MLNLSEKEMYNKDYRRKYYQEHREHSLDLAWKRSQRIKLEVLTYYSLTSSPSCHFCGITDIDVLCLDHVDGGGQRHRKIIGGSSKTLFYQLIQQGFPEGYQVLCANCNLKKELTKHEARRR